MSSNPSYGFKFRGNERVVGWIILDGEINKYWTDELTEFLSENQLNVAEYTDIRETIYVNLLSSNLTDSASLIKLGKLTDLDYLLIGSFGEKSQNSGISFSVLTPHDQIYHYDDFDRRRRFELAIYNLTTGSQDLSLTASTTSSGLAFGGNRLESDNLETRVFLASNFKLKNKSFKKAMKKLCE